MSYEKNEHPTAESIENEDHDFEFKKALTFVTEKLQEYRVFTYRNVVNEDGETVKCGLSTTEWIEKLILTQKITVNERNEFVVGVIDKVLDHSAFIKHVLHFANIGGAKRKPEFSGKNIEIALDLILDNKLHEFKKKILKVIFYRDDRAQHGEEQLKKMLIASTGAADRLDLVALQHWIWLTKRKMSRLSVGHHLMPIFYGDQGGGKTQLILKLLAPIKGQYRCADFLQVTDERCYRIFKDAVLFIDEMAGAERACINRVKNLITSDTVTGRPLYENRLEEIRNDATWIGGSNFPLDEIIKDDSGNRRFYQIDCLPKGKWDRDAINLIDYLSIWQSVDESAESPLITSNLVDAMYTRQQDHWRYKSSIEEFLVEENLIPDSEQSDLHFVTLATIRERYVYWCRSMGRKPNFSTLNNLGRQLSKHLRSERRTIDGRQVRGYLIGRLLKSADDFFKRVDGDGD